MVPVASARSGPRVTLSVLPLPANVIGPAAKSLPLERGDSGSFDSGRKFRAADCAGMPVAPNCAFGYAVPSGSYLEKLGFIGGYALDYGGGASGGAGVTEVRTSVAEYKTGGGANKALAFSRQLDPLIRAAVGNGLSVSAKKRTVAAVGDRRFAFLVRYSAANIAPLYGVDEQFTEGPVQADVTVWAGSAAAAEKLAPKLAKKLDARIGRAQAGKLHAAPVKLPPKQKAGPNGGPDLSQLALQTSDLTGQVTALAHNYHVGGPLSSFAVSGFWANFIPAGQFQTLSQQIQWFATANQASFNADFAAAFLDLYNDPLDLSSLGDGARGAVDNQNGGGEATLVFSSGQLEESIMIFSSTSAVQSSDVEGIAQKVANYIDTAGLGS